MESRSESGLKFHRAAHRCHGRWPPLVIAVAMSPARHIKAANLLPETNLSQPDRRWSRLQCGRSVGVRRGVTDRLPVCLHVIRAQRYVDLSLSFIATAPSSPNFLQWRMHYLSHSYGIHHGTDYKTSLPLSVRVFVCANSHARVSWWIFTEIGTDLKNKSKNKFVGGKYRTTPSPILPQKKPPFQAKRSSCK